MRAVVETVRDPLIVLDAGLHVHLANRSFYETFHVTPEQTEKLSLAMESVYRRLADAGFPVAAAVFLEQFWIAKAQLEREAERQGWSIALERNSPARTRGGDEPGGPPARWW